MNIVNNYNNNLLYTIGIEEEYMLCHPQTYELISKANEIMNEINPKDLKRYSYELILSEIESNTKICNNVNESINEVRKHRKQLKDLCEKFNCKLGISGTHPTSLALDQDFVDNESYNWVSKQLNYYAKKNITFSTHIHIGINDPDLSINICNSLRRWIAPMLALSINSPFFEKELTGMCSSRTMQFGSFPRTEIPSYINSYKDYMKIIENYTKTHSIEKPRQIWWKLRPHIDYGTIEFRMCDAQRSLVNLETLISLAQALVHAIYNKKDYQCKYKNEYLNDSLWKASRFGIECKLTDPGNEKNISMKEFINKMYNYSYESLKYFNNHKIINNINYLLNNNTEYHKQIDVYKKYGINALKKFLIDDVEY